jgi:uncharacterized protein YaaQ
MIHRALALALIALVVAAPAASAATGADYLVTRLTKSGGFAEAGSSTPSVGLTEWAVMGLAAAGRKPALWHRAGGRTPVAYLAANVKSFSDAPTIEKAILALVAMGRSPYSFAGHNLVAMLRTKVVASTGRIGAYSNSTYWGVLAFRAANTTEPSRAFSYIRNQQLSNGGFGWAPGTGPDSNDTAAAMLALRALAIPCTWASIKGSLDYMAKLHNSDNGYSLTIDGASDSQSTAWVVQARNACALKNTAALGYLAARRLPSGAYNYQPGRTVTPAWVTSQVLPAVNGRHYPIRP